MLASLGGKSGLLQPQSLARIAVAVAYVIAAMLYARFVAIGAQGGILLIVAAAIGAYMALNIGANDSANNIGPAIGAGALSLGAGLALAAIAEPSGALIAGGNVVGTIKKGIIDPSLIRDANTFAWLMMAALLSAALWVNIANASGAPVSTTHSIVGGVLGAGLAAGGMAVANWASMGKIIASWVISPALGGLIAAVFLYSLKTSVVFRRDKVAAARRVVPVMVGILGWALTTYFLIKGIKKLVKVDFFVALGIGAAAAVIVYLVVRPVISRAADKLDNHRGDIARLFTIPLIIAGAMLSFAHGSNDVANAIGPLAAINDALISGHVAKKVPVPLWVMAIGALGIATGLVLYGARVIRRIGQEITELDQIRAFCIALAAAITVIIASHLGLPVSTTHITVGAVFGVGFLREFLEANQARVLDEIRDAYEDDTPEALADFLKRYESASMKERRTLVKELKERKKELLKKKARKRLIKAYRKELVKRSLVYKIIAAWLITVPATAAMSAFLFFTIRGIMLP